MDERKNNVYVGDALGCIYKINVVAGQVVWKQQVAENAIRCLELIDRGDGSGKKTIVAAGDDGNLQLLELD